MLEGLGRRRHTGVLVVVVAMLVSLGMAQAANAATISKPSSNTLRFADGTSDTTANAVVVYYCATAGSCGGDEPADTILIWDDTEDPVNSGAGCSVWNPGSPRPDLLKCPGAGVTRLEFNLTGGVDNFEASTSYPLPTTITTVVDGGAGNDKLFAGTRSITLQGGDGADELDALSEAADARADLVGGAGVDTLRGGPGDDFLRGGADADSISGGGKFDLMLYNDHASGVTATLAGGGARSGNSTDGAGDTIGSDVEGLFGSEGNDTLIGNGIVNRLEGAGGNDALRGGAGKDVIIGGNGSDAADYSDRSASVNVSLDNVDNDGVPGENDDIATDVESIIGGNANDTLRGNSGANTIDGRGGDDIMDGLGGVDAYFGGGGNDLITAADGLGELVDCGDGTLDNATTDGTDNRIGCELPAPPPPPPGGGTGGGGTGGGGTGGGGTGGGTTRNLRTMAVSVSYSYFPDPPKTTTRFKFFVASNVPKGSKLVARCVTAKGKKCGGSLGRSFTIKKTKKKELKIPALNKKYRAGSQLEVIVSKSGFKTQVKVIKVRKNLKPKILTQCISPPATRRRGC